MYQGCSIFKQEKLNLKVSFGCVCVCVCMCVYNGKSQNSDLIRKISEAVSESIQRYKQAEDHTISLLLQAKRLFLGTRHGRTLFFFLA